MLNWKASLARSGFQSRPKRTATSAAASRVSENAKSRAVDSLPKLAVFVSGGGSNLRAVHEAVACKRLRATLDVVVTNKPSCAGSIYAQDNDIFTVQYAAQPTDEGTCSTTARSPEELRQILVEQRRVSYVLLAGFVKLIPQEIISAFPKAILNIHPSLLPAFGGKGLYGSSVHRAVVASGARFTGCTVHFIDENYDTGPILAQRIIKVNILEDVQQLAARVLKEEHILYAETVAALVEQRISWREDGVPLIWTAE